MSNYTQEQLREAYRKLPQDVQEAIFSVDTAEIIREIGEKHKLMIDKIGELADEIGLVMLGFTHPSQFISNLGDRLGVDKVIAKEIAEEVNSKIFFPIRENLKKIHAMEEAQAPAPTPAEAESGVGVPTSPLASVGKIPVQPETPAPLPEVPLPPQVPTPTPEEETAIPPATPIAPTTPEPQRPPLAEEVETPPIPPTPNAGGIFETRIKEEIFRSPAEISEKTAPMAETTGRRIDPYKEPTN